MCFKKYLTISIALLFSVQSLESLTLEEKVGQLFIVHFNGKESNEDARRLIEEAHVGGFIYYNWSNELENVDQIRKLSRTLQSLAKIPLWICIDQEGDPVKRIQAFKYFPGNREIARLGNPELAEEIAYKGGLELLSVGINMNLAPVVDISSHPDTSYIAKRTFGDTPEAIIRYAKPTLQGYQRAGIVAVLKHFPGYGDVSIDPHADLPILKKSAKQLKKVELAPYLSLSKQAPAIMTAHILAPALDPNKCATLSTNIIRGLLRKKLGFKGVVISDSLIMESLLKSCGSPEKAAIEAIKAGCDVIILGGKQILSQQHGFELSVEDNLRIFRALVAAVKTGDLPIQTVDEAVKRSLTLKEKMIRN